MVYFPLVAVPSGCSKEDFFLWLFNLFFLVFKKNIFNPNIGILLVTDSKGFSFKMEKTKETGNISVLPPWERCLATSQPCSVHSIQLLASVSVGCWDRLLIIMGQSTQTSTSATNPSPCSSTLLAPLMNIVSLEIPSAQ